MRFYKYFTYISCQFCIFVSFFGWYCLLTFPLVMGLHEKTTIVFLFLTDLFLSSFSPLWQSLFALCLA